MTESRRERLRRELTDQIVEIGRRQLDEGGAAGVSWRGIAREIGMNPASLYTYVNGIDDLFTRILLQSFDRLARAVRDASDAAGPDPRARLLAAARAHRAWAIAHPREYNLIYTDQLPGYAAPPEGPTVEAELAVDTPSLEALSELLGLDGPGAVLDDPDEERAVAVYTLRAIVHGFVGLEINHHAPYLGDSDRMLIAALDRAIDDLVARFGS